MRWWPRPYSELRAAATEGTDGLVIHVTPKKTFEKADGTLKEVDDYPFIERGAMTFYAAGKRDGFNRDDVATLHTQGW